MGTPRCWTDDQLQEAVARAASMAAVIARLGLRPAGGNYATVENHVRRLGLSTAHFTGQRWIGAGIRPHPAQAPLAKVLVRGSTYPTSKLKRRLVAAGVKEEKCERCGRTEWEGQPIPLEMDHENGDRTDHRIENLRLLCCNCHALTPTWRGRNKSRLDSSGGRAAG